jgi:hypothetical protein
MVQRMPELDVPLARLRVGQTSRRDAWWGPPLVTFLILSGFIVYATWAALQNAHYHAGPYLSPFYSPEIFGASPHAWFGVPTWWPSWLPFTPAVFILWAPVGFRLTCYYYRGAYYKAFWADPPNCAVGEPRSSYLGERSLPLVLQNVHRYFLYPALALIVFLGLDVWHALWFPTGDGGTELGIGVGTLVLLANVVLLGSYTFGCHSLRHLIGGRHDILSNKPLQRSCYNCVSGFNKRHMMFAWLSLLCVAGADVYVRLVSMGVITDWRIL